MKIKGIKYAILSLLVFLFSAGSAGSLYGQVKKPAEKKIFVTVKLTDAIKQDIKQGKIDSLLNAIRAQGYGYVTEIQGDVKAYLTPALDEVLFVLQATKAIPVGFGQD